TDLFMGRPGSRSSDLVAIVWRGARGRGDRALRRTGKPPWSSPADCRDPLALRNDLRGAGSGQATSGDHARQPEPHASSCGDHGSRPGDLVQIGVVERTAGTTVNK